VGADGTSSASSVLVARSIGDRRGGTEEAGSSILQFDRGCHGAVAKTFNAGPKTGTWRGGAVKAKAVSDVGVEHHRRWSTRLRSVWRRRSERS
jgi:hypothetical protein